jgi:hypothetical protein
LYNLKSLNISGYLPNTNVNSLDIPYYLGKQGILKTRLNEDHPLMLPNIKNQIEKREK